MSHSRQTNRQRYIRHWKKKKKSQLPVSKSVSVAFQNWGINLERHHWRNEQDSRWNCIEIVGIPDTTNENEVCELIEMATGTK